MGFQPPTGVRVPIAEIVSLNARFGVWAYFNGFAQVGAVGAFVKEQGAPDYTLISGPVLLNFDPPRMKDYVVQNYGGDEQAFLRAEVEKPINKSLDEYFRANYSWEQVAGSDVLSPHEIDQLPSGYDQLNHTLAGYASIMVDPDKKTIQFYV